MELHVDGARGAAIRRRQRRLRAQWRPEQQTVRMALATKLQHSAPRREKVAARAKEEELHETHNATRGQTKTPPRDAEPSPQVRARVPRWPRRGGTGKQGGAKPPLSPS